MVLPPAVCISVLTPWKMFAPHESLPWNPLTARTFYLVRHH